MPAKFPLGRIGFSSQARSILDPKDVAQHLKYHIAGITEILRKRQNRPFKVHEALHAGWQTDCNGEDFWIYTLGDLSETHIVLIRGNHQF